MAAFRPKGDNTSKSALDNASSTRLPPKLIHVLFRLLSFPLKSALQARLWLQLECVLEVKHLASSTQVVGYVVDWLLRPLISPVFEDPLGSE